MPSGTILHARANAVSIDLNDRYISAFESRIVTIIHEMEGLLLDILDKREVYSDINPNSVRVFAEGLCCAIRIEAARIPFPAIFSACERSRASRVR